MRVNGLNEKWEFTVLDGFEVESIFFDKNKQITVYVKGTDYYFYQSLVTGELRLMHKDTAGHSPIAEGYQEIREFLDSILKADKN
jgi:hypothetical protein